MLDLVQSKPPIISTLNYPTATATHQQQQFLVCQFVARYHAPTSQKHTPATLGIKFGQRACIWQGNMSVDSTNGWDSPENGTVILQDWLAHKPLLAWHAGIRHTIKTDHMQVCPDVRIPPSLNMATSHREELRSAFGIEVERDDIKQHPTHFCNSCYRKMKRVCTHRASSTPYAPTLELFNWTPHMTEACPVRKLTLLHIQLRDT